jgi:hypothetical protein
MKAMLSSLFAVGLASAGPAKAETLHQGVPALAGALPAVTGTLVAKTDGPLERTLEIAMFDRTTGRPIARFEEELTKKLHVLATDESRSVFIHEHGDEVGPDGRFRVKVRFPAAGLYHVYADGVPNGLGQQVLRFDVRIGEAQAPAVPPPASGEAGPYRVTLETPTLQEGAEGALRLKIRRNGKPATDLAPYMGVAAHAVLIAEDLSYVHAHATSGGADAMGAHGGHAGHGGHGNHGAHGPAQAATISPDLTVHVTPPRAGTYVLWVQFMGAGEVRTARFTLPVSGRGRS